MTGTFSRCASFFAASRPLAPCIELHCLRPGGQRLPDGWGIGYQPLNARYNLQPAMRLDIAQGNDETVLEPAHRRQARVLEAAVLHELGIQPTLTGVADLLEEDPIQAGAHFV